MLTGTPEYRPFAPRKAPTREQLEAYAHGTLPNTERHSVEHALESDELLREAAEGLALTRSSEGSHALDALRPGGRPGSSIGRWLQGGGLLMAVLIAATWSMTYHWQEPLALPTEKNLRQPEDPYTKHVPGTTLLDATEISAAAEQPESLLIGHGTDDRHHKPTGSFFVMDRITDIQRMEPRIGDLETANRSPSSRPTGARRNSRQLHYLHDLKLVHPSELYDAASPMASAEQHVAARHADRTDLEADREPQRYMNYLAFWDEALYQFTRNDHKACLADLHHLLDQYPDDVNALFYAGLCSYNLGLYPRARTFLHRSATHTVDCFEEESVWYHALTLERMEELEASQEAFARIVAKQGFYAEQARIRLR